MDNWGEHVVNFAKLDNDDARAAYFALVVAAERAGYRTEAGAGGAKRHVKILRGGSQPYSFIVNSSDLLFYLRNSALIDRPDLRDRVGKQFGEQVKLHPNSANEATVRVVTAADATILTGLVF